MYVEEEEHEEERVLELKVDMDDYLAAYMLKIEVSSRGGEHNLHSL